MTSPAAFAMDKKATTPLAATRPLPPAHNRLLACITHEMRTPLTSIMGFADMLNERMAGELNELQAEYVRTIVEKSDVLLQMVDQISDMAHMRAPSVGDNEPSSLATLCAQCVSDVVTQAQKKSVSLSDTVEDASLPVSVDPYKLRSIITNLLGNAVKYTPSGGAVTLSANVTGAGAQAQVRVCVTDTGIGMETAQLERIFEPFYRVPGVPAQAHPGSGLGLFIVQDAVLSLQGTITVESTPQCGSKFVVMVPLNAYA